MTIRCAWCGRYKVQDSWVAVLEPLEPDDTSHGICEECLDAQPPPGRRGCAASPS